MAFDSAGFKSKLASGLGLSSPVSTPAPMVKTAPVVSPTPSFTPPKLSSIPLQPAPALNTKTSTPATSSEPGTVDVIKKGISILNPMQPVTVRPLFAKAGATQTLPYGGPVIGLAHDLVARSIEAIPNVALRTASNLKASMDIQNGKNPTPLKVPFDVSRIGITNPSNTPHDITDTGTAMISTFDKLQQENPGKTGTNIALAVLGGPVSDALNSFVSGDLLIGAAKSTLKATAYDPELNWALDTYGLRGSKLTGEDLMKELGTRFKAKATALAHAQDTVGLNELGTATSIIARKFTGRGIPTLHKVGSLIEGVARTGLQDAKYGFRLHDPRFPEVAPEGAAGAAQRGLPGYMEEPGQAPAFGMSTRRTTRVGGETPETPREGPKPFEGFKDLTTRTLEKLKGKSTVSKQYISDLTNSPDLKQPERDLIRAALESEGSQIDVPSFAEKVRAELLPLKRGNTKLDNVKIKEDLKKQGYGLEEDMDGSVNVTDKNGEFLDFEQLPPEVQKSVERYMGGAEHANQIGSKYESISLPDESRGPVANYSEHIYESPVKTSAGDVHFAGASDSYFGHTRVEDLAPTSPKGYDYEYLKELEGKKAAGESYSHSDLANLQAAKAKSLGGIGDATGQGTTRRVIEVQSDLFQKGRLENEGIDTSLREDWLNFLSPERRADYNKAEKRLNELNYAVNSSSHEDEALELESTIAAFRKEGMAAKAVAVPAREAELSKLEPYKNNAAHFRMIREEVKQAALDGKTKLQFPTGETAMKIEGLGSTDNWWFPNEGGSTRFRKMEPSDLSADSIGKTLELGGHGNPQKWVITDILGDGKFKAVPRSLTSWEVRDGKVMERYTNHGETKYLDIDDADKETFDISGKVDTENPIYKFYEKEVGKYLKNKYGAERITDPQGQSWWEVPITEEHGKNPVDAFGIGLGVQPDDKKKGVKFNPAMAILGMLGTRFLGPEFRGLSELALKEIAESTESTAIRDILLQNGVRPVAAHALSKELVSATSVKQVEQVIAGDLEKEPETQYLPTEEESLNIMAAREQTQPDLFASVQERDEVADNLTDVFAQMKGVDTSDLETSLTDEDLENARMHYSFIQDAILDHPGRALMKYVSRETGQLPEVRGKTIFTGKEIDTPRGKWATKGDVIFQDLVGQEMSKGGDLNVAQEFVDDYINMRNQMRDVQKNLRSIRTSIRLQKAKNEFVAKSKRALARDLARDVSTLQNLVQAAERAGFRKGVQRGNQKVETIVNRIRERRHQIIAIKKTYNLSNKQMRDVTKEKDWRLVPPDAFENWIKEVHGRAEEEHQKNVQKQIIGALVEDMRNPENLRVALELPPISKMSLVQLQEYENALSQYLPYDSFLGPRMITTLENTDLSGSRTWREIKQNLAKETGTDFGALADVRGSDYDRLIYDQALAERNPLYKYMVTQYAAKQIENDEKLIAIQENINELANAARKSRGRTSVDKLVPQDKEVFGWLETPEEGKEAYAISQKMTPEELEYARYVQALYRGWRDTLIEKGTLKKWREAYVTHTSRSFLERWLEDSREEGAWKGFVKSILGSWRQFTDSKVDFPAVGETGQVLGLEKFFKYSLPRGKELVPSKNVSRVVMQYARTFYKKDALDQIIPKVEAYTMALQREPGPGIPKDPTGLNVDGKLKAFVKEWLNNKKGRVISSLVPQGSKMDATLRITNLVMTLKYLGFNLIAQPASAIGEITANFIGMELPEFATGAARFASKEGLALAKKYPGVVGEPPFKRIISSANDAGDTFMSGAFYIFQEVAYRAREQFFLGSLTPQEYETGLVSIARQAEIKMAMGKTRAIEGSKSLAGSTAEGKILTKFKDWAVPLLFTASKDASQVLKLLTKAKTASGAERAESIKSARRLARFVVSSVGIYLFFNWTFNKDKDNSMIGRIKAKIAQELGSGLSAIDPNTWTQPPVLFGFVNNIALHLRELVLLESYSSSGIGYKAGDLKGVTGLEKDFTPALIRQFLPTEQKTINDSPLLPDKSGSGTASGGSKNPALKRLEGMKKLKAKSNPALDRLKKLRDQRSKTNPALQRLKKLRGN